MVAVVEWEGEEVVVAVVGGEGEGPGAGEISIENQQNDGCFFDFPFVMII